MRFVKNAKIIEFHEEILLRSERCTFIVVQYFCSAFVLQLMPIINYAIIGKKEYRKTECKGTVQSKTHLFDFVKSFPTTV